MLVFERIVLGLTLLGGALVLWAIEGDAPAFIEDHRNDGAQAIAIGLVLFLILFVINAAMGKHGAKEK